ncbi:hypothetical protein [Streptomyces genisteinicus]|uniref:Uncharacterized protein n=1 Tax=Streptomyces genisteinicus TaxID=2768068 RepID=A0A7H0HUW8_9ACTN|nr:hypothetical protein [Streptomyces genisteinicus]QNP64334.1 hypothetical protein IAG43_16420 [Streptomyces genisteinicus]
MVVSTDPRSSAPSGVLRSTEIVWAQISFSSGVDVWAAPAQTLSVTRLPGERHSPRPRSPGGDSSPVDEIELVSDSRDFRTIGAKNEQRGRRALPFADYTGRIAASTTLVSAEDRRGPRAAP